VRGVVQVKSVKQENRVLSRRRCGEGVLRDFKLLA
jgi:hypothetical protein